MFHIRLFPILLVYKHYYQRIQYENPFLNRLIGILILALYSYELLNNSKPSQVFVYCR